MGRSTPPRPAVRWILRHVAESTAKPTADVELRDRRPVGEGLDRFAQRRVQKYVHGVDRDVVLTERFDGCGGEAALRQRGTAFHEEHDRVGFDRRGDRGVHIDGYDAHGALLWVAFNGSQPTGIYVARRGTTRLATRIWTSSSFWLSGVTRILISPWCVLSLNFR